MHAAPLEFESQNWPQVSGQLSKAVKSRHGAVLREMTAKAERSVASVVVQQLLEGVVEDAQAWGNSRGIGALQTPADEAGGSGGAEGAKAGGWGGHEGLQQILPGFKKQFSGSGDGSGGGQSAKARRRRRRAVLDRQKAGKAA